MREWRVGVLDLSTKRIAFLCFKWQLFSTQLKNDIPFHKCIRRMSLLMKRNLAMSDIQRHCIPLVLIINDVKNGKYPYRLPFLIFRSIFDLVVDK